MRSAAGSLAGEVQAELQRVMFEEQRVRAGLRDAQREVRAGVRDVDGVVRRRRHRALPWQFTTVAGSANARTAGSMAASAPSGVAAGERQHHELEVLVRVALVACMVVIMVMIVLMIVLMRAVFMRVMIVLARRLE